MNSKAHNWKLWLLVSVAVLLSIFVLQNTRVVEVRFLFWKLEMSRALLLLGMLGVGLATGGLLTTLRRRQP